MPTPEERQQINSEWAAWILEAKPAGWWQRHRHHQDLQRGYEELPEDTPREVRQAHWDSVLSALSSANYAKKLILKEKVRLSENLHQ